MMGHSMGLSFLAWMGLVAVLRYTVAFVLLFYRAFLRSEVQLVKYGAGKGTAWAIVTGSSDGIGKAIAFELAHQKFNLVLLSRTQSKLDAVKESIQQSYPNIHVKTLAFDFTQTTDAAYQPIESLLRDLNVTLLVNNVGVSHESPINFVDESTNMMQDIVNVNILATLRMTNLVLPGMLQRRCGLIATIGSFAGCVVMPMLSVYGPSKSFVEQWSKALREEIRGKGVDVQVLTPMFITSAMSKIQQSSLLVPSEKQFAHVAVHRAMGYAEYDACSSPYLPHALMQFLITWVVPKTISTRMVHYANNSIHKRFLKKQQRTNKVSSKK